MASRSTNSLPSSGAEGALCAVTSRARSPTCGWELAAIVPEINEDRLRRGLRDLLTMAPPSFDASQSPRTQWFGGFVAGMATIVLLAGVLTTTLLLHHRAAVATTPSPRATASAIPSFSPQPTSTPLPSPIVTPVPVSFLPAIGPLCTAPQLEVRLGSNGGSLGNGITASFVRYRGGSGSAYLPRQCWWGASTS
jgi:hypothetical protein